MLQRKREQFKVQIRRNQIQKLKQNTRKQAFNYDKHINQDAVSQIERMFFKFFEILNDEQQIDQINKLNCAKECFQNLKNIPDNLCTKVITNSMSKQLFLKKFTTILKDLIQNQIQSDNEDEYGQNQPISKYSSPLREESIFELLKIIQKVQLQCLNQNGFKIVIQSLFAFIRQSGLLYVQKVKNMDENHFEYHFLLVTLNILIKMFEDIKPEIYNYFLCQGIGAEIVSFLNHMKKLKLETHFHMKILLLIHEYLAASQRAESTKSKDYYIGITITTKDANEKQNILAFCISFIDKEEEQFYPLVFTCIKLIVELNDFLAGQLKDQSLKTIARLILHNDRQIQNGALALLNDFVYHSQFNTTVLLKNGFLLDMLFNRLLIQKNIQGYDEQVKKNVQTIAYIICNTCLTESQSLKKIVINHHIWEQIYSNLHPSSRLFPLILTMQYFFNLLKHNQLLRYLVSFLEALHSFEWQISAFSKQINEIFQQIFSRSIHLQQHEYHQFLKIMHQNKFLYLIKDRIDLQDLQSITEME